MAQGQKAPVPFKSKNDKGEHIHMALFDELKDLGVDVDGGLKRINNNEKLYTRLLGSFVKSIETQYVPADFDAADCEGAVEKAHAIKGTAGNLSITPVYEAYTEVVNLLRTGQPDEARPVLERVIPVKTEIVACIKKYM